MKLKLTPSLYVCFCRTFVAQSDVWESGSCQLWNDRHRIYHCDVHAADTHCCHGCSPAASIYQTVVLLSPASLSNAPGTCTMTSCAPAWWY